MNCDVRVVRPRCGNLKLSSGPGNTAIKTEIPHDPDLNMEPTDKIWVVIC